MNTNLIPYQLRREQPYLGIDVKQVWRWEDILTFLVDPIL